MDCNPSLSLLLLLMVAVLSGCRAGAVYPRGHSKGKTMTLGGSDSGTEGTGQLADTLNVANGLEQEMTAVSEVNPAYDEKDVQEALPTKETREVKILGGSKMKADEHPYLVLVSRVVGDTDSQICGGSVIDEQHVLSAAHCFQFTDGKYSITAGEHDTQKDEGHEQHRLVEKVFNHPLFDAEEILHDVAVLRLSSPLTLKSGAVMAVNFSDSNSDTCLETHSACYVSGWGYTKEGGPTSDVPQIVEVPILPRANCSIVYDDYKNQICAGKEGVDSCQGDSGGPMLCQCGGQSYQMGIVSKGKGCGRQGFPGLYTRLGDYLPWVRDVQSGMYA